MKTSYHSRPAQRQSAPSTAQHSRPDTYTGQDGHMRPDLVDSEARDEARLWKDIKTTQLRRFFGAVRADERRFALQQDRPADSEVQVAMMMLKTKAYYAAARERKHQPIADFCDHHAKLVRNHTDFTHFLRHFEAVTAYHKFFDKDNSNDYR